ncbi:MAG: copper resistance protein NlpE N-terminal domain-containing protein [Arenimonas sp.]|nr:copper resistance protein NlpE N-terminal domain-containing protein [Arenimonas sp.]
MTRIAPAFLLAAATLIGCTPSPPASEPSGTEEVAQAVDMHTSRNSLDWQGYYVGVLPCADCAGVVTTLQLATDSSFTLSSRRLAFGAAPSEQSGQFTWTTDGSAISLPTSGGASAFSVGEGRLLQLNSDGSRPGADTVAAVLTQVAAPDAELAQVLQDHRWTLVSAVGSDNAAIAALTDGPGFAFGFTQGRLLVEGGCNGLRAGYQLSPEGRLGISAGAATLMACDPALMAADATLAALLAKPLDVAVARGPEPTLALMAESGEVLQLRGQPTPESLHGPPTIAFLEVGPQRVACEGASSADGLCLQVRDVSFDAQGLRTGTPGEFQPFPGLIQGYEHTSGTRNIIRIKRFQPDATQPPVLLVLDMTVESESVPQ